MMYKEIEVTSDQVAQLVQHGTQVALEPKVLGSILAVCILFFYLGNHGSNPYVKFSIFSDSAD
jgi:hypothetical protein